MNHDEHMFGYDDEDFFFEEEDYPTMEELERLDFQRELLELALKEASMPEGLTRADSERKRQIAHYLNGRSWDSYKEDPDNARLRKILAHPMPGLVSETLEEF